MPRLLVRMPRPIHAESPEAWLSRIVVASDGRAPSDAALIAARKLAPHSTFGILSVLPSTSSRERALFPDDVLTVDGQAALIDRQLHRLFGEAPDVWIETQCGEPPAVITAFAETHRTPLLITGIGRPRVLERLLGDESTLRLMRLAKTPVFAVASESAVPARRVLIAMDFAPSSIRAARLGLAIAAPQADVLVAHVCATAAPIPPDERLHRLRDTLQTGFCGRITARVLRGDPATELVALANAWRADVIAIGLGRHAHIERAGIGAIATRVVRCASCSVIAVPDDSSADSSSAAP